MKISKKLSFALILALLLSVSTASPIFNTTAKASAATVSISNKTLTMDVGTTKQLKITGTKNKITWNSSKKAIVVVSTTGKITAKSAGAATITATVGTKKYTCQITVSVPITISSKTLTLSVNKTSLLKVNGTSKTVTWTTSSPSVASISSKGTITAKKIGVTTISATVAGKKLTCKVTVSSPAKINVTSYTLNMGTTKKLTITGTTNKVTWSSDNTAIATVSTTGTVTPKALGVAIINAQVDGKKLSCDVTVVGPINPYVLNAPFTAKELKSSNYSMAIPKSWSSFEDTATSGVTNICLVPTSLSTSSAIGITISNTGVEAPDYVTSKEELNQTMSEAAIRTQYSDSFDQFGISYSVTDYAQSDYTTDFGKVLKTEYEITIMGTSTKEIMYDYYVGQYYVKIVVNDSTIGTLETTTDYIVNSIQLK